MRYGTTVAAYGALPFACWEEPSESESEEAELLSPEELLRARFFRFFFDFFSRLSFLPCRQYRHAPPPAW